MKDITGQIFGHLTALRRHGVDTKGNVMWECSCDCGGTSVVRGGHLRSGQIQSCGGKGRGCARLAEIDLRIRGRRFGRWTAIDCVGRRTYTYENLISTTQVWKCRCDCGSVREVLRSNLINGDSTSCGCRAREVSSARWRTHGRGGSHECMLLNSARARAKKLGAPYNIDLADIKIPETCPLLGMVLSRSAGKIAPNSPTLDRKDPHGGYTKGNVWVISNKANQMKSDMTTDQMRRFADLIDASTAGS